MCCNDIMISNDITFYPMPTSSVSMRTYLLDGCDMIDERV